MKLVFIILVIYASLEANLVELYRLNGIDAVKKELDKIVKTKKYWDGYLKNSDVRYGYYESINSVLICNKNAKDIVLYNKKDKQFKQQFISPVFIGQNHGAKQKQGDLKTPTGVYQLTKRLTNIDPFYGPLALVTSYPNLYDKINKKSGSGIWIHGLPFDEKRDDFTKGCVALNNDKLEKLNSQFDYKKSILLLSENKLQDITKSEISTILYQIFVWKDAWQTGDIDKYLSFYDISFKQINGMNFKKFKVRKTRIFKTAKDKKIKLYNINISPYSNSQGKSLFRITMDEDYQARYYKFKGIKELYVELKADGKISILIED